LIDTKTLARTDVKIPTYPEVQLGSLPIALAFSADGATLYTACGGNNAIAVVRQTAGQWKVAGAIPTAGVPTAIAVASHRPLRGLNLKGTGNTANQRGTFNSRQYQGTLERIPSPSAAQIAAGTREVKAANSPKYEPAGGVANLPSLGIRHV